MEQYLCIQCGLIVLDNEPDVCPECKCRDMESDDFELGFEGMKRFLVEELDDKRALCSSHHMLFESVASKVGCRRFDERMWAEPEGTVLWWKYNTDPHFRYPSDYDVETKIGSLELNEKAVFMFKMGDDDFRWTEHICVTRVR